MFLFSGGFSRKSLVFIPGLSSRIRKKAFMSLYMQNCPGVKGRSSALLINLPLFLSLVMSSSMGFEPNMRWYILLPLRATSDASYRTIFPLSVIMVSSTLPFYFYWLRECHQFTLTGKGANRRLNIFLYKETTLFVHGETVVYWLTDRLMY